MKLIRRTSQFKKDVKRLEKRDKDLSKLKGVLQTLVSGEELAAQFHDHVLAGQHKGTRECHVEPDWLLMYERAEGEIILIRTGSHSDVFS